MGSCVSTNATAQSEQVQPIGAGVAGPDPKAVNNRQQNPLAQPNTGRGGKKDPPVQGNAAVKPEDELHPGLTEALNNLPTLVKQHNHKDRTFFLSCVAKKNQTTLEFGAFDVALGHVFSREYTDKELVAGPLKSTTADAVLQQIEAQMRAGSVKMSVGDREMVLSFVVDPKNPTNRNWKVILEKKRSGDSSAFHRLFMEPLLQYLAKSRQEAKDTVARDKELKHNNVRCSNGESGEACKALEEEVEPLKKQNAAGKARQLELQSKIDNLQKRIFKLKNPNACGPEMYAPGAKKYMLHTPYSPNHEPVRIEPNKAAMQMVKMHFAKAKDVGLVMEPMEASLKQLIESAPDNSHDAILQIIKRVDDWDFDVFALAKQTNGGALFMTTFALLHKYGLVSHFSLDEEVIVNFLLSVESGYHPNPYHNAVHAADVLQVTHYIIGPGGMKETLKLTPEDCLAGLLSACVHDYDHPGFNNNFHIRTNAYLATLYNDRSVLENHHCASVYEMMKDERYNILRTLAEDQRKDVRDTMVEMILSTDMGNHTKIFGNFKRRLQDDAEWTKKDDIRLALSIAIKMADVSNCSRPHGLYKQWAERIAQEFYNQGDVEARLRLNISPFMDRRKHDTDFAKGQVSFMNYIVIPLFEAGAEMLPNLEFTVSKIQENKESYVDAM